MELQYQRDLDCNYLILEGMDVDNSYEIKMLEGNKIETLLSFYRVNAEGRVQYWYDITGAKSVRDVILQEGVTEQNLYQIILYLGLALDEIRKYLLSQERLVLSPDTIFLVRDHKDMGVKLCYCPSAKEDFTLAMLSLMELFISQVDHKKEELTKACYELYEIVSKNDFTYDNLTERVQEFDGRGEAPEIPSSTPEMKVETEERLEYDEDESLDFSEAYDELTEDTRKSRKREKKEKKRHFSGFRFSLPKFEKKFRNDRLEKPEDFIYDPINEYEEETLLLNERSKAFSYSLIYEGTEGERDFYVQSEHYRIGTDRENDGVLHSKVVSRRHARIRVQGNSLYLEDLNSRNGTFVNNQILSFGNPIQLKDGDHIRFADQEYRISLGVLHR